MLLGLLASLLGARTLLGGAPGLTASNLVAMVLFSDRRIVATLPSAFFPRNCRTEASTASGSGAYGLN